MIAGAAMGAARVADVVDVAPVWAGHPVGFDLITHGQKQFVGFYDAQRRLTVGMRSLDSHDWKLVVLPTAVGWDSHNYIRMAFDDADQLHVFANMHASKLLYFRTTRPLDVETLEGVPAMVGTDEERCTYPDFLRGASNEFIFTYRSGVSGNGNQLYNVYDTKARRWSRLLDRPLTDGQETRNAYLHGPIAGPDGYFHLVWVWREAPDCATNHHLSYARSRDLRHWETSGGKPCELPMTLDSAEVIDPVPEHGGMINGNTLIGFDAQKRIVVSYHKFDADGNTQIYNARLEDGKWTIHQASDWQYRWDFSGGGSIVFEIRPGPVHAAADGTLTQSYQHVKYGNGTWKLDPLTLKAIGTIKIAPPYPGELNRVESKLAGMLVKWQGDRGKSPEPGVHYFMRWETLAQNRDKPRPQPWPEPSMLRLYKIASE